MMHKTATGKEELNTNEMRHQMAVLIFQFQIFKFRVNTILSINQQG